MSATAGLEIEDLLRELLAREEAMESLASFIEYVSGQEVPRHMRLVCDRLAYPPAQLELFPLDDQTTRAGDELVAAMDLIRSRVGADMIQLGRGFSRKAA